MNNFIVFAISIIAISILGYLAVRSTTIQDEETYKNYIYLAGVLFLDVVIVGIGFYFYMN
ncbi:hypothetical protein [Jeotgalicoccus halotolerans]|uniref:Uncharacterized protein n=1 Tax=Jeotgalicoccus halotolerans TaxID=157227 RepID=A0A3E0B359_9STAP|nr:hypothetical protein [Jeotgalicoccus halotolerans]REG26398.1 hypothetical protein DFR63_0041 [Jeotgalicoccus halotolerans]